MKMWFGLVAAGMLAATPALAKDSAKDFNTFVINNYYANSDTEGRVAVGGDARFQNYSVGEKLGSSWDGRDTLVVGKSLTFNGGDVKFGNIVSGQPGSYSQAGAGRGTTRTASGPDDFPIDMKAEGERMLALSAELGALASTGTVSMKWGGMQLSGTETGLNIFTIRAEDLDAAHTFALDIPQGSFALFNVTGKTATMDNFGFFTGIFGGTTQAIAADGGSRFLFNFWEAETLTIANISVRGSVLAPKAALQPGWGTVDGNLIIGSSGSIKPSGEVVYNPLQVNYYPYIGTLLDPTAQVAPVPEPASWAMMIGGFGAMGLAMRRRRRRAVAC